MPLKSAAIDKNDQTRLELGRARLEAVYGAVDGDDSFPFFFSNKGGPLDLLGAYHDASAFLIGGGPSFARVDKSKLDRVWTMTMNNTVATYRGNANCIVDDPSRFNLSMWLDPRIQKFAPMAVFGKPLWDNRLLATDRAEAQRWQKSDLTVADCPNVIGYRRNEKFDAARFLYEDTINWGCHAKFGGGRSVMLPALRILFLLGFRRIYLLGIDFEMTEEKKYHFTEYRPASAIRANMKTYARLHEWFSELQPHFLKEGFVVKNCNSESRLTVFPFIELEEAVAEATVPLGNFTRERTCGMYKPVSEKVVGVARRARGFRKID
jgi:hypothetical protein